MKPGIEDEQKRKEIFDRIDKLNADSKPKWGKMTPAQTLKHIRLVFSPSIGELEMPDKSSFFTRTLLKKLLLSDINVPEGKTPKTFPEVDMVGSSIPVEDFETEKKLLKDAIDRVLKKDELNQKHFMLGKINNKQWYRLIYRHITYHLRQFGV
jgi:hypothetical protein